MSLNINKITPNAVYGKHKIPRYIYHLTSKTNYDSILKDGFIKTTNNDVFMKDNAVFAIELTNFFKWWKKVDNSAHESIQDRLIKYTSKGEKDIVILRIPTEKLNQDSLTVRSQNLAFNFFNSEENEKINSIFESLDKSVIEQSKKCKTSKDFLSFYKKYIPERFLVIIEQLCSGISAKNSSLFEQRGEAIEYIYKNDIPVETVEKIGQVNISQLKKTENYNPTQPIKSVFSALLKNTPEEKATINLNI